MTDTGFRLMTHQSHCHHTAVHLGPLVGWTNKFFTNYIEMFNLRHDRQSKRLCGIPLTPQQHVCNLVKMIRQGGHKVGEKNSRSFPGFSRDINLLFNRLSQQKVNVTWKSCTGQVLPSAKYRPTCLVVDAALRPIGKSRHGGHKIANISRNCKWI